MRLTIAQHLTLSYATLILLGAALGGFCLERLAYVDGIHVMLSEHDVNLQRIVREVAISDGRARTLRERALAISLLSATGYGGGDVEAPRAGWRAKRAITSATLEALREMVLRYDVMAVSAERSARFRDIAATEKLATVALADIAEEVELQFSLADHKDFSAIAARLDRLSTLRAEFDKRREEIGAQVDELSTLGREVSAEVSQKARLAVLAALALMVVLGTAASVVLQRGITRPLSRFADAFARIGAGDLRQQVEGGGLTELAHMATALNGMVSSLREFAARNGAAAEELSATAAEILAATQQHAASAVEQAAAVQQTATTMDEIKESGRQISERATAVTIAAEAAAAGGNAGVTAVQDSARAMEAIRVQAETLAANIVALSGQTQAVGEVFELVRDIAERSNLLSLNAAIEAAAEALEGRRFAVVAHEMRSLAEQSKDATVQVRTTLEDIQQGIAALVMLTEETVKRVEFGKQQSDLAEHSIHKLADTIDHSVGAFEEILAATNQQQIGVRQVATALANIRDTTAQSAVGTSQLERAARNLARTGDDLRVALRGFQL